jgi:hypothetical protein
LKTSSSRRGGVAILALLSRTPALGVAGTEVALIEVVDVAGATTQDHAAEDDTQLGRPRRQAEDIAGDVEVVRPGEDDAHDHRNVADKGARQTGGGEGPREEVLGEALGEEGEGEDGEDRLGHCRSPTGHV